MKPLHLLNFIHILYQKTKIKAKPHSRVGNSKQPLSLTHRAPSAPPHPGDLRSLLLLPIFTVGQSQGGSLTYQLFFNQALGHSTQGHLTNTKRPLEATLLKHRHPEPRSPPRENTRGTAVAVLPL